MSRKKVRLGAVVTAVIGALFVGVGATQAADNPTGGGDREGNASLATSELVFRPLTPCRIVDTRHGGGGVISDGQTRTYSAVSGLIGQGASLASCGVPSGDAAAITGNVTITGTTGFGNLRVFPASAGVPNASTINWNDPNQTFANEVVIGLSSNNFKVFGDIGGGGHTHVIVDVTGYYEQQIHVTVNSDGTIHQSNGRIVSVTKTGTGEYDVTIDRTVVSNCASQVTVLSFGAGEASYSQGGGVVSVNTHNSAGALADQFFALNAMC